jgi:hypothetical protein
MERIALVKLLNTFEPEFGRIFVTTMLESSVLLGHGVNISKICLVEMKPFSESEAKTFLSTRLPDGLLKAQEKSQLIKNLEYSPTGLSLIAAFASQSVGSKDQMESCQRLMDKIAKGPTSNAFALTMKAVVDEIADSNDKSYEMLCAMSVLDI